MGGSAACGSIEYQRCGSTDPSKTTSHGTLMVWPVFRGHGSAAMPRRGAAERHANSARQGRVSD
jgi:hypothetical protein